MKLRSIVLLVLSCLQTSYSLASFPLTDTSPDSPEFQARFLGSYGINPAIEPKVTQEELPLYESIAPLLQKNPDKAIQTAIQGIDKESNAAFDFLVGSLHYSQRNFAAAETYLRQAIDKFPDFRRAHRNLSLTYIQQEAYSQAIPHLLAVIRLGGGDAQSYSLLAYSYLYQEKYTAALSTYRMARIFTPDSVDVRRGEAQCLLMMRQYDQAIALFDELISESPEEQDYWLLQANAYLAREHFDEAIANLEIAHTVAPATWDTHKLLADLYLTAGLAERALHNYTQALTINPNIPAANAFAPAQLLTDRGLYAEAKRYLNTLDAQLKSPLSPQLKIEKKVLTARLELQIGDPTSGLQQLRRILQADPLNTYALLTLANHQLDTANYAEAEFYFERALTIPATKADALVGLARTAVQQNKFAQAINYLEQAQTISPRDNIKRYITRIENALAAQNQ